MRRFLPRPSGLNKPCIRHEAASALATWSQYFKGNTAWPGLTLFLIACHHGKVRTVLMPVAKMARMFVACQSNPTHYRGPMGCRWNSAAQPLAPAVSSPVTTSLSRHLRLVGPGLVADLLGGWKNVPAKIRRRGPFAPLPNCVSWAARVGRSLNCSSVPPTSKPAKTRVMCAMSNSSNIIDWPVVSLAGITNDTLGSYLLR